MVRVENKVEKGDNTNNQYFCLFPTLFSKNLVDKSWDYLVKNLPRDKFVMCKLRKIQIFLNLIQ